MSNEIRKSSLGNAASAEDIGRLAGARKHGQVVRRESDREGAQRSRPDQFGGMRLQMSVNGELPGYHLYWENDENGAIEQLLAEGFDFVTQTELNTRKANAVVEDLDISSVVSRFVKGQKVDGSPLRAYLMKCPDDIWREREQARYDQADAWDADIRQKAANPEDGLRRLGPGLETKVDTKFRKSY